MRTAHLSDEEIQILAFDEQSGNADLKEHILLCNVCHLKVSNYRLMASALQSSARPAFDFDIVVPEMPLSKTSSFDWKAAAIVVLVLCSFITAALFVFSASITALFKNMSISLIVLSGVAVVAMVAAQLTILLSRYRQQLKAYGLN